ncbi:hypothetical protein [Georgenia wangjunii]|uniref:hypothetical protein n=1 Tax=Georgenia wangjunii TaxID=3117730 RepID=UPI002F26D5AE
MTSFVAPLVPLRQALLAVKVHANPKDDVLFAVRLLPGGDDRVHVSASDRYTAAVATAPIIPEDGEGDPIDLAVSDVDKFLAVFRSSSDKDAPEPEVRIRLEDDEVTFSDVGGLFEGQSLTLPAHSRDSVPDIRRVVGTVLAAPSWTGPDHGLSQRALAKLVTGTKTYGEAAFIDHRGEPGSRPSLLAVVGEHLIVVLAMTKPTTDFVDEDTPAKPNPDEVRTAWRQAFREAIENFQADGVDVDVRLMEDL